MKKCISSIKKNNSKRISKFLVLSKMVYFHIFCSSCNGKNMKEFDVNIINTKETDKNEAIIISDNDILTWDNVAINAYLGHKIQKRILKIYNKQGYKNLILGIILKKVSTISDKTKKNIEKDINEIIAITKNDRLRIICLDYVINKYCYNRVEKINEKEKLEERYISIDGENVCIHGENYIKNLVFQGGGVKGFGYVKMLEIFREEGKLNYLKNVIGSSSGSLFATVVAFSISDIGSFVKETFDSRHMKKSEIDKYFENYSMFDGLTPDKYDKPLFKSAFGVIKCIDEKCHERIFNFLNTEENIDNYDLNSEEKERLKYLKNLWISIKEGARKNRKEDIITFKDLAILNKIGKSKYFKNLTIIVACATDDELILCNAENTPDMPIALAVRDSMGLPGIFKISKIGNYATDNKKMQNRKIIDGGFVSNTPTHFFVKEKEDEFKRSIQQMQTLTVILDENGAGFSFQSKKDGFNYGSCFLKYFFANLLIKLGGGNTKITKNRKEEDKALNDISNFIVAGNGYLDTLSINPTKGDLELVDITSRCMVKNWILQHQNEDISLCLCNIFDDFYKILLENLFINKEYGRIRSEISKISNKKRNQIVSIVKKYLFNKKNLEDAEKFLILNPVSNLTDLPMMDSSRIRLCIDSLSLLITEKIKMYLKESLGDEKLSTLIKIKENNRVVSEINL